jgi:Ser/Thr protein kinase RdoA (MazF antagonist)
VTLLPDISPADLVAAIEAQYDLRVSAPPRSLPPGFHSRAWLVDTTDGSWVVKLSNPTSDPIPKLERQTRLSSYLNQHGICAPQILRLRNGSLIACLTIDQLDFSLQLMQYQLLSRVRPERAPDATLVLIGELAARLHQILDHYPERGALVADRHKSADEWGARDQGLWPPLQDLPDRAQLSHGEQIWLRSIDQRAVAFVQQRFPDPAALSMAVLHGDLNFEHIQFLTDGTPYLFDFGDMCWGPIAHELAVIFLNIFCDSAVSFSQWEAIQRRILAGYSSKRQLSHPDRAMISVFLVNRVVARAQYSVELAHAAHLAINWQDIKQTYRLAEYLLTQAALNPPIKDI